MLAITAIKDTIVFLFKCFHEGVSKSFYSTMSMIKNFKGGC